MTLGDWWRPRVINEIYPRSFQDANGDGIGDPAAALGAAGRPATGGTLVIATEPRGETRCGSI